MEIPRELQCIGPLFGGLYLILWLTRGLPPFLAMTVFSIGIMMIVPQILIQVIVVFVILVVVKRHRITTLIFFLSYFCSGISIQQLHIYYLGLEPPPPGVPISPLSILMITPAMAAINIIIFFQLSYLPTIVWLFFLLTLALLTPLITALIVNNRIDAGHAILFYLVIIVSWTFSVIPLYIYSGTGIILTPIPLGPLVALNTLSLIPSADVEPSEELDSS